MHALYCITKHAGMCVWAYAAHNCMDAHYLAWMNAWTTSACI